MQKPKVNVKAIISSAIIIVLILIVCILKSGDFFPHHPASLHGFTKGTKVLVVDENNKETLKNIEDIKLGETVVTDMENGGK